MKYILSLILLFVAVLGFSQTSIHQQQLEYYNSLGNDNANYYEQNTIPASKPATNKATCDLNKVVYGWHPYWSGSAYVN